MVTGSRVERKKYEKQATKRTTSPAYTTPPKKKRPKKRWLGKLFLWLFLLLFLLGLAGVGTFGYYAMNAPSIEHINFVGQVSSKIYDRDGNLIKELGAQNRDLMTEKEIPTKLKEAVIAIEDTRFYSHMGIDPIRIAGAFFANVKSRSIAQGGSTITQQLIKLSAFSTDSKDQTLERKAQEAWLALQMEQHYSKDTILMHYLNKTFYSNNTYGAKTAARTFFDKSLDELTWAEAALLAGMPQAPSNYDPYRYPEAAKERRDLVLHVLREHHTITQEEYDTAIQQSIESMLVPLNKSNLTQKDLMIDAYLDVVYHEVKDALNADIFTDGIEVYTNLNMDAQKHLYDTVNNDPSIAFPDDHIQTAVSIIDVTTGELQAVIGGRKQEVFLGLNRANTLNRSIGSTMKPLADYGPAIEYLNYSTGTLVVDEPYKYSSGDELNNFDFEYKGNMTLREALSSSRNIPALKLLQKVGLDNSYAFLQKLGIHILNDNKKTLVEANAIGGEVTPIQLSAAYAAIANYGVYNQPRAVKKVILKDKEQTFTSQPFQAMKDSTAYMLTDILKQVPGNFAAGAKIDGLFHAGKTGTTNYTAEQLGKLGITTGTYAAPDGWYVGFTPKYAIATWVGYDNPYTPGNYLTLEETRLPQHIYAALMKYLMATTPNQDWAKPSSVSKIEIEKYSDPIRLPGDYTPLEARSTELFVRGTEPKEKSTQFGRFLAAPTHFDADYNPEHKTIIANWSPPANMKGVFELSINGTPVYVGNNLSFEFPAEPGQYELRLRIVDGNSSSDVLIISLNLKNDESSSSSSEETSSDSSSSTLDETHTESLLPEFEHTLPSEEELNELFSE